MTTVTEPTATAASEAATQRKAPLSDLQDEPKGRFEKILVALFVVVPRMSEKATVAVSPTGIVVRGAF